MTYEATLLLSTAVFAKVGTIVRVVGVGVVMVISSTRDIALPG